MSANGSRPPFDPATLPIIYDGDYPPYLQTGTGEVSGYLRVQTKLFGTVTYAKTHVFLMPATNFTSWYILNEGYQLEHPGAKDLAPRYPESLRQYSRATTTDENGFFRFSGLPDGKYYINAWVQREVDDQPVRHRTVMAMGPDGDMVSVPVERAGLRIRADDAFVAVSLTIDAAHGAASVVPIAFDVVGEYTCCKAEI